jgi:O-antigen/teichoic acid export membrane protein
VSTFAKDLFSVLKSRATVIVCGVLTSVLTARYIGPIGNGIIATLTVYPDLLMSVGSLGIRQSTTYFIGQKKHDERDIVSSILYVWIFSSLFCLALCYLLLKFSTKGDYSNEMVALAIVAIPFSLFNTYASGVFLGKNNIKEFNRINWVPNVIRFVGTLVLVVFFAMDVRGAMIGIIAGYFFLSFLVFKKLKKIVPLKFKYNPEIIKGLLRLGIIYAISFLIISLNYKVDVMLLERLSTDYEIGIYSKGVSVVQYLWEIPTLLSTIIFARSAVSKDPKEFSYKVATLLRICTVVILAVSVVFYFLSDFIMITMYGEAFAPSAMVQKLLMPGILLLTVFKVLNMDLAGKGKPWIAMKAMVPSLILNVILNYMWDAKYGANGASMASTVSYALSAVLFLYFYAKEVQIPVKEILTFKKSDYEMITSKINQFLKRTKYENLPKP